MRVAVASEAGQVARHYGRCPEFVLADVEDGKVTVLETVRFSGHECGERAIRLAERGVKTVICSGIGRGAQSRLLEQSIEPCPGITGPVEPVLAQYAAGALQAGDSTCDHGEHWSGGCHH